jgi:hypothetical protein
MENENIKAWFLKALDDIKIIPIEKKEDVEILITNVFENFRKFVDYVTLNYDGMTGFDQAISKINILISNLDKKKEIEINSINEKFSFVQSQVETIDNEISILNSKYKIEYDIYINKLTDIQALEINVLKNKKNYDNLEKLSTEVWIKNLLYDTDIEKLQTNFLTEFGENLDISLSLESTPFLILKKKKIDELTYKINFTREELLNATTQTTTLIFESGRLDSENKKAKQLLETTTTKFEKLQLNLNMITKDITHVENNLSGYQKSNDTEKSKLDLLEIELISSKKRVSNTENEININTNKLNSLFFEYEKLKNFSEKISNIVSLNAVHDLERYVSPFASNTDVINLLNQKIKYIKQKTDYEKLLMDLDKDVSKTKHLSVVNLNLLTFRVAEKNLLISDNTNFKKNIESNTKEEENLRLDNKTQKIYLERVNDRIKELNKTKNSEEKELNTSLEKLKTLELEVKVIGDKQSNSLISYDNLNLMASNLQIEIKKLETDTKNLKSDINTYKELISTTSEKKIDLEAENSAFLVVYQEVYADIDAFKTKNDELKIEIEVATKKKEEFKINAEKSLKIANEILKESSLITDKLVTINRLTSQFEESKKSFQDSVDVAEKKNANLTINIKTQQTQIDALQLENQTKYNEIKNSQKNLKNQIALNNSLEIQNDFLKKTNAETVEAGLKSDQKINELVLNRQVLEGFSRQNNTSIKFITTTNEGLNDQIQDQITQISILRVSEKILKTAIEASKQAELELKLDIEKFKMELSDYKIKNNTIVKALDIANAELSKKKSEYGNFEKDLTDSKIKLEFDIKGLRLLIEDAGKDYKDLEETQIQAILKSKKEFLQVKNSLENLNHENVTLKNDLQACYKTNTDQILLLESLSIDIKNSNSENKTKLDDQILKALELQNKNLKIQKEYEINLKTNKDIFSSTNIKLNDSNNSLTKLMKDYTESQNKLTACYKANNDQLLLLKSLENALKNSKTGAQVKSRIYMKSVTSNIKLVNFIKNRNLTNLEDIRSELSGVESLWSLENIASSDELNQSVLSSFMSQILKTFDSISTSTRNPTCGYAASTCSGDAIGPSLWSTSSGAKGGLGSAKGKGGLGPTDEGSILKVKRDRVYRIIDSNKQRKIQVYNVYSNELKRIPLQAKEFDELWNPLASSALNDYFDDKMDIEYSIL